MSPMKHYQGPLLQGVPDHPADQLDPVVERAAAQHAADAVDNPKEPERSWFISTHVHAFPNGTYGVTLRYDEMSPSARQMVAEGNAEHPEMALMLAFTKLWSQIDRPRCAHCGQLLPEEGQTT